MIRIERLSASDVSKLHALASNVPEFRVNKDTVNFWSQAVLANAANSKDVFIFAAKRDGAIIGFILASYSSGLKKSTIENMYVQPEFRKQGVGDALLAECSKNVVAAGCEYIATLVPIDAEGAESLYLKAGFSKGETFRWLDKSFSDNFSEKE